MRSYAGAARDVRAPHCSESMGRTSRHPACSLLVSGSYFPPQVGGISRLMVEVCRHFGPQRLAVLTGVAGSVDDLAPALRVHRVVGCVPPRSIVASARLLPSLGMVLCKERPSVIQYATLEDAQVAHWTYGIGYPHILYAHGNEILSASRSRWDKTRSALSNASFVVANSRYTAGLLTAANVDPARVRVVHPGCDLDLFSRVAVTEDDRARWTRVQPLPRLLLSVSNLVERKGHDVVIRALSMLGPSFGDVLFLVAGSGPHRAALERLAADAGVAERVVFLGQVPTPELPRLYSAAAAFILASRDRAEHCDVEGFGIVFIEAAACGAATIGGRSGGVADAVDDGKTGLLVDPHDPAAVAAAISTLLADPEVARRLGDAGRRRAQLEFGWQRFGRAVEMIVDEAVVR